MLTSKKLTDLQNALDALGQLGREEFCERAPRVIEDVLELIRSLTREDYCDEVQSLCELASQRAFEALDYSNARCIQRVACRVGRRVFGRRHDRRIAALARYAVIAKSVQEVQRASWIERAVLEVWSQSLAPDDPRRLRALMNHALTLHSLGKLEQALSAGEQSFRTLMISDRPQPEAGWIVGTHAMLVFTAGALIRSERLLRIALAWTENPHSPELALARLNARMNLSLVISRQGRHAEAAGLASDLLDEVRKTYPVRHHNRCVMESFVASQLESVGRYQDAEPIQRELLAIALERDGADHHETLRCANNVASNLGYQRRFQELHDFVVPWCERADVALDSSHPIRIVLHLNQALAEQFSGQLSQALERVEGLIRAVTERRPAATEELAVLRARLGAIEVSRGNLVSALNILDPLLVDWEARHDATSPSILDALKSVAAARYGLGDIAACRRAAERRVELLHQLLSPDHPDACEAALDLALAIKEQGHLAQAIEIERNVVERLHAQLAPSDTRLATARINLAWSMQRIERFDDAYEQFAQIATSTPRSHRLWILARAGMATGELFRGNTDFGVRAASEVLAELEARGMQGDPLYAIERRTRMLAYARSGSKSELIAEADIAVSEALERLERTARGGSVREAEVAAAFEWPLLNGLSSLVCGWFELGEIHELIAPTLRAFFATRQLPAIVQQRVRESLSPVAEIPRRRSAWPEPVGAAIADAALERDRLDRARSHTARGVGSLAIDPQEIISRLEPDEAVVLFTRPSAFSFSGPGLANVIERYVAFVVTTQRTSPIDLGTADEIEALADEWLEAIGSDSPTDRLASPIAGVGQMEFRTGSELRRRLIDPLLPALSGTRRLSVIAEGIMEHLPLDALPLEGRFLADEFEIRLMPWWKRDLGPPPVRSEILCVGDVEFGVPEGDARVRFESLPGSRREVDLVATRARIADPSAVITRLDGENVRRNHLVSALERARIAHIATHGYVDAPRSQRLPRALGPLDQESTSRLQAMFSPLDLCGLALSQANSTIEGRITARSLAELDLSGLQCVILCACETRRGWSSRMVGVQSLARAFHLAGARTVIATMDRVGDEAAANLIHQLFPAILASSNDPARVLDECRRALRAAGVPTREWAFFVSSTAQ